MGNRQRIALGSFVLLFAFFALALPAFAVASRPNALDRMVDAIPAGDLLVKPAVVLVDGARFAAAQRLQAIRTPLWVLTLVLQILVLAYFWQSGAAARVRDWLRVRLRNEFAVRFCIGALLVVIAKLAAFIPQYIEYRALRAMTLVNVLSLGWLHAWFVGTVIASAIAGLLVAGVLSLADRTHQWYLYTIAGIFGLTIALAYLNPFVIAPAFARYSPLPPGAARVVDSVESSAGIRVPALEEHISDRTKTAAAFVSGLGNGERIVLSDTVLQSSPPPELRFVTAHVLEHVRDNVPMRDAIAQALTVICSIGLAILIADRIGFRRDDDAVSRIALLGALLVATSAVVLPFYYAFERRVDRAADAFAVAQSRDPAAGVRYFVRRADQDLLTVCPKRWQVWFIGEHEPVGPRISAVQGRADDCASTLPRR
ncbi:MAG: M48 family metalloprotease [Candidatus Eremiobacteraeota bacterium]|nr:M48 family metalloprotease [Candidatus Eremiobacteraeota bacterium]